MHKIIHIPWEDTPLLLPPPPHPHASPNARTHTRTHTHTHTHTHTLTHTHTITHFLLIIYASTKHTHSISSHSTQTLKSDDTHAVQIVQTYSTSTHTKTDRQTRHLGGEHEPCSGRVWTEKSNWTWSAPHLAALPPAPEAIVSAIFQWPFHLSLCPLVSPPLPVFLWTVNRTWTFFFYLCFALI